MDVEDLAENLKEIGLMNGFNTNEIEYILELMQVQDLKHGMHLFQVNENKDFVIIILKDRFEIVECVNDDSSEQENVVRSVGEGEVYRLSNLMLNQVYCTNSTNKGVNSIKSDLV